MEKISENAIPIVREWYRIKMEAKDLAEQEKVLRAQAIEATFGSRSVAGTVKQSLSDVANLSFAMSAKISVDKDAYLKHKDAMLRKGIIGDESVIRLKPEVSATAYKFMSEADKAEFSEVFVHGFSSPTIDVEMVKGK